MMAGIVVLAIDALEHELVERYGCTNLKQRYYGRTDISEFSEPRTMVLWSSFLTGRNMEREVLTLGKELMWSMKVPVEDTFLGHFTSPLVIDLPAHSYEIELHERERTLLKRFFQEVDSDERELIRAEYNSNAFEHHREIKKRFLKALEGEHNPIIVYISLVDVIGHVNFGNTTMMRLIYRDLDELARTVVEAGMQTIVVSDHGMKAIGPYGDHSEYGFWSTGLDLGFETPRITDFFDVIVGLKDIDG